MACFHRHRGNKMGYTGTIKLFKSITAFSHANEVCFHDGWGCTLPGVLLCSKNCLRSQLVYRWLYFKNTFFGLLLLWPGPWGCGFSAFTTDLISTSSEESLLGWACGSLQDKCSSPWKIQKALKCDCWAQEPSQSRHQANGRWMQSVSQIST